MKTYALTLDLKNDEKLIDEYERYHKAVWPEIKQSILDSGIIDMHIYRLGTRLFMTMQVEDHFSFAYKATMDAKNPKIQEWEELMWTYQQALPQAKPGEKWLLMKEIFKL
ncbi:L-fucose mutarotase [Olivibacter ginsenosidimutans]|uniref:L-fucose mutarotase n=1 Tax=Olivibacter ginsenosidimutans TaxID=1176537 RepID=A0ABP9BZE4_9SPHI